MLGAIAVGAALAWAPAALAGEGDVHALVGQIRPQGLCRFEEPTLTAVNDESGEVYVYNRGDNYLDRFGPAAGSTPTRPEYECLGRQHAGKATFGEEGDEGLAVDNSPGSPARGTVYLVAPEEHQILKFRPAGGVFKSTGHIRKLKARFGEEEYEQEEFEAIYGLGVDGGGQLWVDGGERILTFAAEPSKLAAMPKEVFGNCSPRPGFAVSPNAKYLYLGREREGREGGCEEPTAIVKVPAATGELGEPPYKYQFEREPNSGVAVDGGSGDVYFGSVTNVSVFGGEGTFEGAGAQAGIQGQFIERFGSLEDDAGVAVDADTGEVFATDAQKDQLEAGEGLIDVYALTPVQSTPPVPAAELPDRRVWELVTPVNKHGGLVQPPDPSYGLIRAAQHGGAIAYTSSTPIVAEAPSSRAPEASTDLSRREGGSWSTEDLGTPRSNVPVGAKEENGTEYKAFSSDLSTALVQPAMGAFEPDEPPLSPEATETTDYLRDIEPSAGACVPVPSSCYQALVSPGDDLTAMPFGDRFEWLYATPDSHHVVLSSSVALTGEGAVGSGEEALYEWNYVPPSHTGEPPSGALDRISIAPAGEEAAAGGEPRLGESPGAGVQASIRNAVSDDGSRAFWAGTGRELYVRDVPKGETLRIDTPEAGQDPTEARAVFRIANTEGTRVFFTDGSRLTADATSDEEEIERGEAGQEYLSEDLYVCELGEQTDKLGCIGGLTDLSADVASPDESASVQGVVGASEDGSTIYFVADGDLAPGAGPGHCGAGITPTEQDEEREGKGGVLTCNLYVAHRGEDGWEQPRFIARLTERDRSDWSATLPAEGLTSRVSPDGDYLAFMSSTSLTGYHNRDADSGVADEEVYLYDLGTDRLVCASCDPTGAPPVGLHESPREVPPLIDEHSTWQDQSLAANISGWVGASQYTGSYLARNLSDSGRLFFNGVDPLVPAARNGKADVYEYEPDHVGTCGSESGCIALISSGASDQESAFMEASEGGEEAFILTSAKLSAQDADTAYDVYDARVCSEASPCEGAPPVAEASRCATSPEEATCKPPATVAPALPAVAPSVQPGAGNSGVLHEFEERKPKVGPKKPTRAQLLAKALAKCKRIKRRKKRASCERSAQRSYGAKKASRGAGAVRARRSAGTRARPGR